MPTTADLLVGMWKIAVSLRMLIVATGPRFPRRRRADTALLLVLADVAFGLVKVVAYHESVHAFLVVDLALLGAWTAARRLGVAEDSLTWSA